MAERTEWAGLRDRRMAEPGAREVYRAARLAFELGGGVRRLRRERGWSQAELARAAGMTQSAVARFEAGGTVPTPPVLDRLAAALNADLEQVSHRQTGAEVPNLEPGAILPGIHRASLVTRITNTSCRRAAQTPTAREDTA